MYEWNLYILDHICCCFLPKNVEPDERGLEIVETLPSKTEQESDENGENEDNEDDEENEENQETRTLTSLIHS